MATFDADQRSALMQALLAADGFTPLHEMADKVAEATGASHDEGLEVILALLSFTVQLGAWDEPSSAVAKSVANSEDLDLSDADRSSLNEILNKLLVVLR